MSRVITEIILSEEHALSVIKAEKQRLKRARLKTDGRTRAAKQARRDKFLELKSYK